MHRIVICALLFFLSGLFNPIQSQVSKYARSIVDTLASDALMGRGYVDSTDKKAADFIRSEFERLGLKSYENNFYQHFPISVNTFPDSILFIVEGDTLKAGFDFLVEPGSPSIQGSFKTIQFTADDLLTDEKLIPKLQQSSGKLIAIRSFEKENYTKAERERITQVINFLKFHDNNPAEGTLIFTREKLTWSASTQLYPHPVFTIQADSITKAFDEIFVDLDNEYHKHYTTQNVIGYLEGKNRDSAIVLTAHYDHLGIMGPNAIFNGANDNASGVAMLLSMARHYAENEPNHTTVFIAFSAEELGLLGAEYYTENPLFELSRIKFLLNFDLAGTGDEGIQVVNGSVYSDKFNLMQQINNEFNLLPQVKVRGPACNSDHCWFDRNEVPNFFIYTLGGIPAYHDVHDRPETLPLTEFEDYYRLLTKFINQL